MFESLKRAIDEIFGSVIRPAKDWILRQSWGIRVGTAGAYRSGTAAQKARTLSWMERVLRDRDVRSADTERVEWVRAEVLIGLAETAKRVDCKDCAKAGSSL